MKNQLKWVLLIILLQCFILCSQALFFPKNRNGGSESPVDSNCNFPSINGGAVNARKQYDYAPSSTVQKTTVVVVPKISPVRKPNKIEVASYFAMWYFFTVLSSSAMTTASKAFPLPWAGTSMRLWIGSAFIFSLWKSGIRTQPIITRKIIKSVIPVAVMSTLTVLFTGMAYAAGSLPFVSIIKSAEPATMALLGLIILKKRMPLSVYASLFPVIVGVGLASLKDVNFSMASFIYAMVVNLTSALRSILAKDLTNTGMSPPALCGLMMMLGAAMTTPVAVVLESKRIFSIVQDLADPSTAAALRRFLTFNIISGVCLYLFYEGSFKCLSAVGPLSHSIGNTIGRVVVIVAGVMIYKTKMSAVNILGATLAVGGVFLYSQMQHRHMTRQKVEQDSRKH